MMFMVACHYWEAPVQANKTGHELGPTTNRRCLQQTQRCQPAGATRSVVQPDDPKQLDHSKLNPLVKLLGLAGPCMLPGFLGLLELVKLLGLVRLDEQVGLL